MYKIKLLLQDPDELVIWNNERPIAYLNRADASDEEFAQLVKDIQADATISALIDAINDLTELALQNTKED